MTASGAASRRPGPRSIEALGWLARVGMSPPEPMRLVMDWTERHTYDHVARLVGAGYVRKVPMTRGDGSLLVVTNDGAAVAEYGDLGGIRSVGPTTWAHAVACAWTAAWFEVRDRPWQSERQIRRDDRWAGNVTYKERAGTTRRVQHHPDLGTNAGGAPIAVEVELQRKSDHRLRGILAMYAKRIDDGDLGGVVYVAGNDDVHKAVVRAAGASNLHDGFRLLSYDDVKTQTREARA